MTLTHTSAEVARKRRVRHYILSGMVCLVVGIVTGYGVAAFWPFT